MGVTAGDMDRAVDLFSGLGEITTRRMMGGLCLYHAGTIFAILTPDGELRLKGAGAFISELEEAGCTRWNYVRSTGQAGHMPYWSLPEGAGEDPDLACDWARRALRHL